MMIALYVLWILALASTGYLVFYQLQSSAKLKLLSPLVISFGLMVGFSAMILYTSLLLLSFPIAVALSLGWAGFSGFFFYYVFSAIEKKD